MPGPPHERHATGLERMHCGTISSASDGPSRTLPAGRPSSSVEDGDRVRPDLVDHVAAAARVARHRLRSSSIVATAHEELTLSRAVGTPFELPSRPQEGRWFVEQTDRRPGAPAVVAERDVADRRLPRPREAADEDRLAQANGRAGGWLG